MPYVFGAFNMVYCIPEVKDSLKQLILIVRLDFSPDELLQWTPLSSKKARALVEVCLGEDITYEWKECFFSRICTYSGAFIIPVDIQIPALPGTLIHAHTWTLTTCLALHTNIQTYTLYTMYSINCNTMVMHIN